MSTSVSAAPDLATLEQMLRPSVVVGNAGDTEVTPQVGGRFFTIPGKGELKVEDIQDYPWGKDAAGKRVRVWSKKETTMPALDVAKAIVADATFGPRGLYIKVNNPAVDDQSYRAARARYIAWQTDYCLGIEGAWIAKVAAHQAGSPGAVPLRQPRRVRVALAWLSQNHDEMDNVELKEFVCRTCYADFDVSRDLREHIEQRHPGLAREISNAVDAPAEREPEGDVYDPTVILAKARELKVKLGPKELEGLIDADKAVIKAVTVKLAAAADAAEKKR